jgi:UPF0755 protein
VRKLLVWLIVVGLVAGAAVGAYYVETPAGPTVETFVVIPPGTGARGVASLLEQRGIIWNKYAFLAWRVLKRGTLKAGEYRFDHPVPLREVYARLLRGDVYTVTLTVPEGYNIFDLAHAVEGAGLKPAAEFLAGEQKNVDLIAAMDPTATSLEGYLFPDTYKFPRSATAREMQAVMVRRFRQKAEALGITGNFHQVVTLASLVEKETGAANERGLVASVFTNRLAGKIPLATDPSVIYGLLLAGRFRGTIYASDLKQDAAYNTYVHAGLPPGPISNPGEAALAAALHPPATHYLYFVSDNAGHSKFATTLEEHDRNVAEYRRRVQAGGGR